MMQVLFIRKALYFNRVQNMNSGFPPEESKNVIKFLIQRPPASTSTLCVLRYLLNTVQYMYFPLGRKTDYKNHKPTGDFFNPSLYRPYLWFE